MNKMRKHRSRPLRTGAVMAAAVMLGIIDGYGKANMYKVNKILKRRIRDGFCLSSGRSHTCCGVVSNGCCDVSALRGAVFKLSPAPLPPPKPAIACTS